MEIFADLHVKRNISWFWTVANRQMFQRWLLKFGKNRDLELITISSTNTICEENFEIARTILIKNGEILGSACETKHILVLSTYWSSNIPKIMVFPDVIGEYFILFKELDIQIIFYFFQFLYIFTSFNVNKALKKLKKKINR